MNLLTFLHNDTDKMLNDVSAPQLQQVKRQACADKQTVFHLLPISLRGDVHEQCEILFSRLSRGGMRERKIKFGVRGVFFAPLFGQAKSGK